MQACMDALDQLCSSGAARPQTVRPLLQLLLTPGPELGALSLSPAVSALCKMAAALEAHAIVVSETIRVLHAAGGKDASAAITDLLHTLLEEVSPTGFLTNPLQSFPLSTVPMTSISTLPTAGDTKHVPSFIADSLPLSLQIRPLFHCRFTPSFTADSPG